MSLQPFQRNSRPVYLANYYGFDGIRKTASLGTTEERIAKRICLDLEDILAHPENQPEDPTHPRFSIYMPRALKVAFNLTADPVFRPAATHVTSQQIYTLASIAPRLSELQAIANEHGATLNIKIEDGQLDAALKQIQTLQAERLELQERVDEALNELRDDKRKHHVEVKTTYAEALSI